MDAPSATVDQLESGWRALSQEERERAQTLLERASRIIQADCPGWRRAETRTPGLFADICCDMVKRAMTAGTLGAPEGVSQMNSTTGPFTEGYTFANPMGNLYLLDSEKRRLGNGAGHAFHILMTGERT